MLCLAHMRYPSGPARFHAFWHCGADRLRGRGRKGKEGRCHVATVRPRVDPWGLPSGAWIVYRGWIARGSYAGMNICERSIDVSSALSPCLFLRDVGDRKDGAFFACPARAVSLETRFCFPRGEEWIGVHVSGSCVRLTYLPTYLPAYLHLRKEKAGSRSRDQRFVAPDPDRHRERTETGPLDWERRRHVCVFPAALAPGCASRVWIPRWERERWRRYLLCVTERPGGKWNLWYGSGKCSGRGRGGKW